MVLCHFQSLAIGFISNYYQLYVLFSVLLDLIEPKILHVLEGLMHLEIEHNHDALSALVVGACDCPEALLASSVPNLQLDARIVELKSSEWAGEYLNLKSTPIVAR